MVMPDFKPDFVKPKQILYLKIAFIQFPFQTKYVEDSKIICSYYQNLDEQNLESPIKTMLHFLPIYYTFLRMFDRE